jgi:hypothetical protein
VRRQSLAENQKPGKLILMSNPALPRGLDRPNRNLGRELKAQAIFLFFRL